MSTLGWAAAHRFWALGLGMAVLVVAAAAAVWFLVLQSPGTDFGVGQALRLYRHDQGSNRAGSHVPPSGVYRYRTSGGEQLSFGNLHRSFPALTTMIVTGARCATIRWEPIEQHVESQTLCPAPDGGLDLSTAITVESFAGVSTTDLVTCPVGTTFLPKDPVPGARWQATCRDAGLPVGVSGQVIGMEDVPVDGHDLPAVHLRITITENGSARGTSPADYWVSPSDGLILRQQETVQATEGSGTLGGVRYSEHMAADLTSTAPVR